MGVKIHVSVVVSIGNQVCALVKRGSEFVYARQAGRQAGQSSFPLIPDAAENL